MKSMTAHAIKRAAQRNINSDDIVYVLKHGSKLHKAGACFYYLGGKDIPPTDRQEDEVSRLEGTTLVLDPEEKIIMTIYRNREKGLKEIRKKRNYLGIAIQ
jgi:hypothetical protein